MDAVLDLVPTAVLTACLRGWNFATTWGIWGLQKSETVLRAVLTALRGEQYIFFAGNERPYLVQRTAYWATTAAMGQWLYEPGTKRFYQWPTTRQFEDRLQKRNLPVLSVEVVEGGRVHYDLTDFLEEMHWYSEEDEAPSAAHLFEAWSLSSGIVLNRDRPFRLKLIFAADASEVEVAVDDLRPLSTFGAEAEAEAESPATSESDTSGDSASGATEDAAAVLTETVSTTETITATSAGDLEKID